MKTLEANSIRIGRSVGEMVGIDVLFANVARANTSGAEPGSIRFDII